MAFILGNGITHEPKQDNIGVHIHKKDPQEEGSDLLTPDANPQLQKR